MAFKTSLATVNYYTQYDPYFYTVDNRPLVNLHDRDDAIADELDKRVRLVDITGSASPTTNVLPSGWTITRVGAGDYTVTHNFATVNYGVVGTVMNSTTPYVFYVYAIAANTFSIRTVTLANVATDVRFTCVASKF